jgi:hypothetical protein
VDRKIELTPAMLAIGAFVTVTWGVLLWAILRRGGGLSNAPPINIWNVNGGGAGALQALPALPALGTGEPFPVAQMATKATAAAASPSRMSTFTLPVSEGARVMTAASNRHWKAVLRNIGPPGSTARVADSPNNLNFPSASVSIPAGDELPVIVAPRAALFAIGDVANVQLTVIASEEAA